MKNLGIFPCYTILLLMTHVTLNADSIDQRIETFQKTLSSISFTTKEGAIAAKTAAVGPVSGPIVSIDALLWQTTLDGAAYAAIVSSYQNIPVSSVSKVIEPTFNLNWGVKGGLGYHLGVDGWDLFAEYTYFYNKGHNKVSTNLPSGLDIFDSQILTTTAESNYAVSEGINYAGFAANGYSSATVMLNDVYLVLGRNFYLSQRLTSKPNFGVEAAWLSIKQKQLFSGGDIAYTVQEGIYSAALRGIDNIQPGSQINYLKTSDLVSVGPRVGLNTSWNIISDFSLCADIAQSLLFGYFKKYEHSTYTAIPDNLVEAIYNFHRLVPVTTLFLGGVYEPYFFDHQQRLYVRLGYETQYFFNAVALQNGRISTSLGFDGATLNVRWDF